MSRLGTSSGCASGACGTDRSMGDAHYNGSGHQPGAETDPSASTNRDGGEVEGGTRSGNPGRAIQSTAPKPKKVDTKALARVLDELPIVKAFFGPMSDVLARRLAQIGKRAAKHRQTLDAIKKGDKALKVVRIGELVQDLNLIEFLLGQRTAMLSRLGKTMTNIGGMAKRHDMRGDGFRIQADGDDAAAVAESASSAFHDNVMALIMLAVQIDPEDVSALGTTFKYENCPCGGHSATILKPRTMRHADADVMDLGAQFGGDFEGLLQQIAQLDGMGSNFGGFRGPFAGAGESPRSRGW